MKSKLLAILFGTTLIFFGSVLWFTDQLFYADRSHWAELQLKSQVVALSEAAQQQASLLRKWASVVAEAELKKINWNLWRPLKAMGRLSHQGNSWIVSEWAHQEEFTSFGDGIELLQLAINNLKLSESGDVQFHSFVDSEKKGFVFYLLTWGNKNLFFIDQGESLKTVLDAQKGGWSTTGLINLDGMTISHTTEDYVGQKISKGGFFDEMLLKKSTQGSGFYDVDKMQSFFVYYQKVPQLNLYVYSMIKQADLLKGRTGLWMQLALMAVGLLLVGAGVIIWGDRSTPVSVAGTQPLAKRIEEAKKMPAPTVAVKVPHAPVSPAPMPTGVSANSVAVQKEKMEAYRKIASALAHDLRGPLNSILGFGQTVLPQVQTPEAQKKMDQLLREARGSRELLDKLLSFAGENTTSKSELKIDSPLAMALKNMESVFSKKGIKVVKNFKDTTAFSLQLPSLTKAFENILNNSVEALERKSNKEIKIDIDETSDFVQVIIADNGEGIEEANKASIFDPFYTTKSSSQHLGLGLCVALGILKEHLAFVDVQSTRGKGTVFTMKFEKLVQPSPAVVPEPVKNLTPLKAPPSAVSENDFDKTVTRSEIDFEKTVTRSQIDADQLSEKTNNLLSVNVDDLLEMPGEALVIDEPTDVKVVPPDPEGLTVKVDMESIENSTHINVKLEKIDSPAFAIPERRSSLDDFKVEIRRPERNV